MRTIVFFIFFLISGRVAWCQQGNFLYIDAAKGQPFYVKIKDKVHSSSQSGYIILPGITESSLDMYIGFPADIFPEQRFVLPVNNSDQGFHLNNTGDMEWSLLNLKTMMVIKNNNPAKTKEDTTLIKKTDAFSLLLSRVVNDPAVLIAGSKLKATTGSTAAVTPPVVLEPKPAEKATIVKPDTLVKIVPEKVAATATDTLVAVNKKTDSVMNKEVAVTPTITPQEPIKIDKPEIIANPAPVRKLFDRQFEKIYEAAYVDGKNDTVRISYPINVENAVSKPEAIPAAGCRLTANDQDVDNLRVKILAAETTDEKIATSKIFFQSKCFTVKQIKALSELFTGDEDKYRLFDTVYPYTADRPAFTTLINLLNEDYYKNRFKAIIRN